MTSLIELLREFKLTRDNNRSATLAIAKYQAEVLLPLMKEYGSNTEGIKVDLFTAKVFEPVRAIQWDTIALEQYLLNQPLLWLELSRRQVDMELFIEALTNGLINLEEVEQFKIIKKPLAPHIRFFKSETTDVSNSFNLDLG